MCFDGYRGGDYARITVYGVGDSGTEGYCYGWQHCTTHADWWRILLSFVELSDYVLLRLFQSAVGLLVVHRCY